MQEQKNRIAATTDEQQSLKEQKPQDMELSSAEKEKIKQNEQEEALFRKNLHSLIGGDKKLARRPLVIGKVPNIFAVCDKNVGTGSDLIITKKVIEKCMRPEIRDENGRRLKNSGHNLSEKELINVLNAIKAPVMVLNGNTENTLVAVTEFKDGTGKEIIVPVEYNKNANVQNVVNIASVYGRDDFSKFIDLNIQNNNVLAINTEKANEMLLTIGRDFPKANTIISFDNSIAYSLTNVKYPDEKILKNSEKEKILDGKQKGNDDMPKQENELLERIAALEKQVAELTDEQQSIKEQINKSKGESDIMYEKNNKKEIDLGYAKAFSDETCIAYVWDKNNMENGLIAAAETTIYGGSVCELTDKPNGLADKIYSDVSKGRNSEAIEAAKLSFENSSNAINKDDLSFSKADNGTFAVWNKNVIVDNAYVLIADASKEKPLEFFKDVSDDVKKYIVSMYEEIFEKENHFEMRQENIEELTNKYLTLSKDLDNACKNLEEEFNIKFPDKTEESRNAIMEYINFQLEGSELTESQREILTGIKNSISEIRKMETVLNVNTEDLKFISEVNKMKQWTENAQETAVSRSEQNKQYSAPDTDAR